MFAGGTKKKDKKLNNSVTSMYRIFNIPNGKSSNSEKNKKKENNTNNIQEKSFQDKNDIFLGFENIESPKEEDFGDFRVIVNPNQNLSVGNILSNSQKNKSKFDILNLMIINKSNKYKKALPNIKSYFTSMYYNKNLSKNRFDMKSFKSPCYIFDSNITEILGDLDINFSNNLFLYMSYRSGFENLNNVGCGNFTSDCGWGCMLRCCQMMLSRGIIKRELYKLYNTKKTINNTDYIQLKKEVLYLFNDKFISLKELKDNLFLSNLYEKYQRNQNNYELIPPYSIYILCKLSDCAGIYTSDNKMIKCFIDINEQIFNNSYGIAYFENGIILKQKLLQIFCTKRDIIKDKDENNVIVNSIINIQEENFKKFEEEGEPLNVINIFDYYGEEYNFSKGGLIFISLRLGLRNLDESFFDFIPLLFKKVHNNIGFVSGKKNRAFYFIGCNGNKKLIYADPHLNQKADEKDICSYEIKDLYLLDIKELCSGLTLGININNSTDLKILIYDLYWLSKNYPNIISFK